MTTVAASTVHLAIDASRVSITATADLSRIATSAGRFTVDGIVREVTTQPAGFFDLLVTAEGLRPTEEYQYRGGTLRLGQTIHRDAWSRSRRTDTTAVWEAGGWSTAVTGADLDAGTVLTLLDRLDLRPGPEGLAVLPGGGIAWYDAPQLVKEVPGVGLLEVLPLSADTARSLPSWPGTPVAGGELYRDEMAPGVPYLVLVTETALVNVLPDEGGIEAATEGASALSVEWEREP